LLSWALFDDVAGVHDQGAVGDVACTSDVVGDVEERDALSRRWSFMARMIPWPTRKTGFIEHNGSWNTIGTLLR
jgi:hypothetical protein